MLSGIGPARKLKALGIEVVLDQPLVGQGMSDNPTNGFIIPIRKAVAPSLAQVVGITHVGSYIESIEGPFDPSSIFSAQHYTIAANQVITPYIFYYISYFINHILNCIKLVATECADQYIQNFGS